MQEQQQSQRLKKNNNWSHVVGVLYGLNTFKPNGISNHYHLEKSNNLLRDVGWYFSFVCNFDRTFCKHTVGTLIRHHALWRLGWVLH